jgi:DNA-binding CsgD family transcriptional regulator
MLTPTVRCSRLIGRQEELALLRERCTAAAQGAGSLLLIGGNAGVGKSRLSAEFAATCRTAGVRFVSAYCLEYAQQPFAPFLSALRELSEVQPGLRSATGAPAAAGVARSGHGPLEMGERPAPAPAEEGKPQQFDALASALEGLCARQTTVVAIEDLHWADIASLELLRHLLPTVERSGLLLLATYRTDNAQPPSALATLLARISRHPAVWRIALQPLAYADTQALIAHSLGGQRIEPRKADEICALAEGNPLFAEELLASALEAATEGPAHRSLPATIYEAVQERLQRLSEPERGVLRLAAAIGRQFEPAFLAQLLETPVQELVPALKHAVEQQIVVEQSNGAVHYAFRHALIRETIYRGLLTVEARPLHAKIAAAIERSPGGHTRTAELAYHWWSARQLAEAARYNELAGDDAAAVYAHRDAAAFYERALECGHEEGAARAQLSQKLGTALRLCHAGDAAESAFGAALAYYESAGQTDEAAQVCLQLAHLYMTLNRAGEHIASAQRAVQLAGGHGGPLALLAHTELALCYTLQSYEPRKALEQLKAAELHAQSAQSAGELANYYERRACVHLLCGRADAARADVESWRKASAGSGDDDNVRRCWGNFALFASTVGERALALQAYGCAIAATERCEARGSIPGWTLAHCAYVDLLYGELPRAKRLIERALCAIPRMLSLEIFQNWVALSIALQLDDEDLLARAARPEMLEEMFRVSGSAAGNCAAAFAQYELARQNEERASAILKRALDALSAPPPPGDFDTAFLLIAQHCEPTDWRTAEALFARTSGLAKIAVTRANFELAQAHAARRWGDASTAAAKAASAAAVFEQAAWPYWSAQALEVAGRHKEALQAYERIGNVRDARRLQSRLFPSNRRGRPKDALTPREREIARLVCAGKSNRAVAGALTVSERTIESHLASIFGKLQLGSRAELAERVRTGALRL